MTAHMTHNIRTYLLFTDCAQWLSLQLLCYPAFVKERTKERKKNDVPCNGMCAVVQGLITSDDSEGREHYPQHWAPGCRRFI